MDQMILIIIELKKNQLNIKKYTGLFSTLQVT